MLSVVSVPDIYLKIKTWLPVIKEFFAAKAQVTSITMIYGVYIVSKSGGLIFNLDHNVPKIENEQTFSYPLDIKLVYENKSVKVSFGQRDGIVGTLRFSTFI